jgi:hypothetical protein
MAEWDTAYLINFAESVGGTTGLLGMSVLHAEVAYAKAGALFDIMGSSFTPQTPFGPWAMTSSH